MKSDNNLFDFSDLPKDHPNYDITNAKVLGKFKDEFNGKVVSKFVGLKPKMYAFEALDEDPKDAKKKAKGVPKHIVKQSFQFQNYCDTLFNDKSDHVNFNAFRSYNHQVFTVQCNKIGLSSCDNKRYLLSDKISSVP